MRIPDSLRDELVAYMKANMDAPGWTVTVRDMSPDDVRYTVNAWREAADYAEIRLQCAAVFTANNDVLDQIAFRALSWSRDV